MKSARSAIWGPSGAVKGGVELKRQFRIRDGVNIVDVLQDELRRASNSGMKNIVATIQRDQNAVIPNPDA